MAEIQFPVLWHNQEYIDSKKPLFTVFSRNSNYGDGVFETLRVKNNKIYYWDFHYERLQKGIHTLEIVPDAILRDKIQLYNTILKVTQINNVKNTVKVKIQVYRADEIATVVPKKHDASTLIYCVESLAESYALSSKEVIVYPDVPLQYSVLSPLKTLNRLPYILAGIYAHKHQVQDAILLNMQQELTETTHSNLFYIIDDELCTPPVSSGCLDGVLRKVIMNHFKVTEKGVSLNEIGNIQAIFTTNVIRGITAISSCKGLNKTFDTNHFLMRNILDLLNTL